MCDQLCRWLSMRWSLVGKMKKFHKFLWNIFYQISLTHCLSNMDPRDSSAYKKKYKIPNTAKVCEISDYADQLIAQRRNQRRKSNTKSIFRPTVRRAILDFHHVITQWPILDFTIFFLTELLKCCILDIFPTGISHVSWLLSLMSSRTISKSGQPVLLPVWPSTVVESFKNGFCLTLITLQFVRRIKSILWIYYNWRSLVSIYFETT